jgi:hypothetical protein
MCIGCFAAGTVSSSLLSAFAPAATVSLDLSHNRLSGPLPDYIGNTTATTNTSSNASANGAAFWNLNLSANQFIGSVPDSYAALIVNSENFDLSSLALSGQLPASLLTMAVNASTFAGRCGSATRLLSACVVKWKIMLLCVIRNRGDTPTSIHHFMHLHAASLPTAVSVRSPNICLILWLRCASPCPCAHHSAVSCRGKTARFTNSSCLCGSLPSWLLNLTLPDGTSGTGLGAGCSSNCTPSVFGSGPVLHQDWPGGGSA